ncbi:MAG: hypothetical protein AAGF79_00705 [Pseudomonadota bacterium]
MTLITQQDLHAETASTTELLKALQDSLRDLRRTAVALKQKIEEGETSDLTTGAKEIAAVDQLARNCMKTEVNLADICNRNAGIVRGGYALDLDVARAEVGCRLGRLRACCAAQ